MTSGNGPGGDHQPPPGYSTPPPPNYAPPGYGPPGNYGPPAAYGPPGSYPPPGAEPPPGLALTIVITIFFGLFGLIPAAVAAGKARRFGHPEGRYWIAFGASLAGTAVLWLGAILALVAAVGIAVPSGAAAAASQAETVPSLPSAGEPSTPSGATVSCAFTPDTSGNPNLKDVGTPPATVPASGTAGLTLTTNFGSIGLTLDQAKAPCAAASFGYLAKRGFFDRTPCHREVNQPTFGVLQCGDPTGTGSGGPAYTYGQEVTATTKYPRGTIAMANSGAPDTTSSQFFLCFTDTQLSPDYTVVGTVDPAGLAVLDRIAANGNDGSFEPSPGGGAPKTPVTIQRATVG